MWSAKKSILLSKICTAVVFTVALFCIVTVPWLDWFLFATGIEQPFYGLFVATLELGGVLALFLLAQLFTLLKNIGRDEVFTKSNVNLLRYISWCCFAGAIITFASGFYYVPWFFVAAAAGFVGLIVRVVKNVIAKAVIIKEENDLTV